MNWLYRWSVTVLGIETGWHFLNERLSKVIDGGWSSAPFLDSLRWIFVPCFRWMSGPAAITSVVDFVNMCGLILAFCRKPGTISACGSPERY